MLYFVHMKKHIARLLAIAVLAVPLSVFADTVPTRDSQLEALYRQLIELLQREIVYLNSIPVAALAIEPTSGKAPLDVVFTVLNISGTEAIDFGDGYSSGSTGCARNSKGWCDLTLSKPHTYRLPGNYVVSLYSHPTPTTQKLIGTTTVSVSQ